MNDRSLVKLAAVGVLAAATVTSPVRAHQVPLEVTAYLQQMEDRLRVLVRVPASLLADPRLPVGADGYFDFQAALGGGARQMAAVAADIARNLDLMDEDQPLAPPAIHWTISPVSDKSFETFAAAAERLAARQSTDARIDPSAALVDLQLDYPIQPAAHRFSIRVNGFGGPRDAETVVRHVEPSGNSRTIVTSGAPRRLDLDPRGQRVAAGFARIGAEQLTLGVLQLMFVLCLAIPARPLRDALKVFGVFAICWVGAVLLSALLSGAAGGLRPTIVQMLAASALAVAALQNVTAPRPLWRRVAAALFGLIDGIAVGSAYRLDAPLAGSHPAVAFVSFIAPMLLGSLWLLLVAHPSVVLVRRSRLPERWATVLLSAIPIHTALHVLMSRP